MMETDPEGVEHFKEQKTNWLSCRELGGGKIARGGGEI